MYNGDCQLDYHQNPDDVAQRRNAGLFYSNHKQKTGILQPGKNFGTPPYCGIAIFFHD
jgi:hypothetical protein